MPRSERGHRALPHIADVILEAWGRSFPICCEEAVAALLGVCIDSTTATASGRHHFSIARSAADSMLLDLLDEIVFVLDTCDAVPDRVEVKEAEEGLDVVLHLVDRAGVEVVGSAPKAISRSELAVDDGDDRFRCSFLVDV